MKRTGVLKEKLAELLKTDIKDDIVSGLMQKYDDEIVVLEDPEEPEEVSPSFCRREFKEFLEGTIENSIKIERNSISFGIGDQAKMGLDEELDDQTTDCLKIIATILSGISGNYILVTTEMAMRMFPGRRNYDLGRTGEAYIMRVEEYNEGIAKYGWPFRPIWKFSNFEGIPDFFDAELDLEKYMDRLIEVFK